MQKKPTEKSKKSEILESYQKVLKELKERKNEKPIEKVTKEEEDQLIENTSGLSSEKIIKDLTDVKLNIGKSFDSIEEEMIKNFNRFEQLRKAINLNNKKLEELHQITTEAESYEALIDSQRNLQKEFEDEMNQTRQEWEKEKKEYEWNLSEEQKKQKTERQREEEQYLYNLKITRQKEHDAYQLKKEALEKELSQKKEILEKELKQRELLVSEKENELSKLKNQVDNFPAELENKIQAARQETAEKIKNELKFEIEISKKEMEGNIKLYEQKIAALTAKIKEQDLLINQLSDQIKAAGNQVQNIAIKAIEGASARSTYTYAPYADNPSPRENISPSKK